MANLISTLHPSVRAKASALLSSALLEGIELSICQALRTPAEQELIYAKGRTRPGEACSHQRKVRPVGSCAIHPLGATVTQLRYGWHNVGRAFDVLFVVKGKRVWKGPWERVGELGEKLGLIWGGRWKSPDRPHFEYHPGLTSKDLPRLMRDPGY